MFETLQKTC